MPQAKQGDTVAIHYKGTLDDGTVFDSSEGREPLEFSIGANQVIPGFDAAVLGLEVGQGRKTRIEPEQAYGPRREEMLITVGKDRFPEDTDIQPGMQFQVGGASGQTERKSSLGWTSTYLRHQYGIHPVIALLSFHGG